MLLRLGLTLATSLAGKAATALSTQGSAFNWQAIEPSEDLRYHDCYDGFRCARLTVPLDWNNTNDSRTVAIAIITLPAKVPVDHPDYGGTIITNPGGPGGSGIAFLRALGLSLQLTVDGNKKYEIMSFDPRGVAHTTPRADCFGDVFARDAHKLMQHGLGPTDGGEYVLRRHLALYKGYGSVCEDTQRESGILQHISTSAVCRDMLAMVDRTDELRKKELAVRASTVRAPVDGRAQHPIANREGSRSEAELPRLQYYGLSYGTIIGNQFASMFPGRVGRLVIDGVVDIHDYMAGIWTRNLKDADATVNYLYETCLDARDRCALYAPGDANAEDIRKRVSKLIADLDASPLSIIDGKTPKALTSEDIRLSIGAAAYAPIASYPRLAELLADAIRGNYSALLRDIGFPRLQDACSNTSPTDVVIEADATYAIACGDADDKTPYGLEYYQKAIEAANQQSEFMGPRFSKIVLMCSGLQSSPKWRFGGPWTTPEADPSLKPGVPAAPMLLLTSRLDPVTPAVNANLMSAGHPGSAVVIQNSVGHCAFATEWNECTNKILREYFEHGIVPQNGTICNSTCKPWQEDCEIGHERANIFGFGGRDEDSWLDRRFPLGI